MKRITLLFTITVLSFFSLNAQQVLQITKYKCLNEWEIKEGDSIILGRPSEDTAYNFVSQLRTNKNNKKPLIGDHSDKVYRVNSIFKYEWSINDISYYLAIKINDKPYYINIEPAIQTMELTIPEGYDYDVNDKMSLDGKSIIAFTGTKYQVGEKIKVGTGSMDNGDFKFIRRSATSMQAYNGKRRDLVNAANALPRNRSQLSYKIIRIDKRGRDRLGYVYYPIIDDGWATRYEIDLENAIKAGEIIDENYNKNINTTNNEKNTKTDELKKLFELKQTGALTEEEYQTEKAKILNNNK